jgi:hypothetical protein
MALSRIPVDGLPQGAFSGVSCIATVAAVGIALGLLGGCAGGGSGKSGSATASGSGKKTCTIAAAQSAIRARCPDSECITAVGYSSKSLAEAESDVKARISAQISSTVRSEVESRKLAVERNGREQISSDFWSRVVSTSEFKHAQLIKVDATKSCATQGGGYVVPASLHRAELASILEAEASRVVPPLKASQSAAQYSRHILTFTRPYGQAQNDFIGLYSMALQYRAVTGAPLPGFAEIDARQSDLARHGRTLVLSARVEPRIEAPADMTANIGAFKAALNDQLGRRGLQVGTSSGCAACVVATVRVQSKLFPNGSLGPMCELSWDIAASDPAGGQSLSLGGGRVRGLSTRGDMEDAISKAWRRLSDSTNIATANLAQFMGR